MSQCGYFHPHEGNNAWTAVKIEVIASDVSKPDYRLEMPQVDIIQISTWMTPNI
jgi:hypothetical protein